MKQQKEEGTDRPNADGHFAVQQETNDMYLKKIEFFHRGEFDDWWERICVFVEQKEITYEYAELKRKRIFQILVKSGKGRSLANSFDWLNDEPNYESLLNRGFRIDDEQYYKMLSLCKVEKFEVYRNFNRNDWEQGFLWYYEGYNPVSFIATSLSESPIIKGDVECVATHPLPAKRLYDYVRKGIIFRDVEVCDFWKELYEPVVRPKYRKKIIKQNKKNRKDENTKGGN